MIKGESAKGRKTKKGSFKSKKIKGASNKGRKTKERSIGYKKTGILVVVGILVCLLASFWFG